MPLTVAQAYLLTGIFIAAQMVEYLTIASTSLLCHKKIPAV
jgi:hypothetical protein